MLATNDKQYMEVIRMSSVTEDDGEVDWSLLSEGTNAYEKTYLQEIILSILEDSEESNDQVKRIMFVQEQHAGYSMSTTINVPKEERKELAPGAAQGDDNKGEEEARRQAESTELRLNWSRNFLEKGGFQYILQKIYSLDVTSQDKKQIEFMLTLARVFLTAAFATDTQKDIGQAIRLARKSSSIDDGDTLDKKAVQRKEDKKDKL